MFLSADLSSPSGSGGGWQRGDLAASLFDSQLGGNFDFDAASLFLRSEFMRLYYFSSAGQFEAALPPSPLLGEDPLATPRHQVGFWKEGRGNKGMEVTGLCLYSMERDRLEEGGGRTKLEAGKDRGE
jgi:hypothetical protein